MKPITVRAIYDEDASVWTAEATDLPDGFGLATSAPTLEALEAKLPEMVCDLLGNAPPIEIIVKVRDRAVA